jgi:membrane protease YdiL (CAAX protease family)
LLASISLGVLIVAGYEGIAAEAGKPRNQLFILAVGTFSFHGVALVLIDVFLRAHQIRWSEAFGFNEPRRTRAVLLALVVGVIVLPIARSLYELSAMILQRFQMPVEPQQAVKALQTSVTVTQQIMYGLAAIFIAPIIEELVFRGILYPAVKQSGHRKLALWGISIFFAATHGNMAALVPLVFLAVMLTLLYETTNNLMAPILTHSFFNAVNFAYILWGRGM